MPERSRTVIEELNVAIGRAASRALFLHPHEISEIAAGMGCAAPLTEVVAEARLKEEPGRHWRRPCDLLHALPVAIQVGSDFRSCRRRTRRVGGSGRAPNNLLRTRFPE